jgi:hypothetical protein
MLVAGLLELTQVLDTVTHKTCMPSDNARTRAAPRLIVTSSRAYKQGCFRVQVRQVQGNAKTLHSRYNDCFGCNCGRPL